MKQWKRLLSLVLVVCLIAGMGYVAPIVRADDPATPVYPQSKTWEFTDSEDIADWEMSSAFSVSDGGLVWVCDPNSHTNGTAAKVNAANSATWTDYYVSTDVTVYKNTAANGYPMAALLVYGGITVRVRPDPVANQYDISVAGDTAGDKTANCTMNNTVVDGNVTDVSTAVSFNLAVKVGQGKLTVYIDGKEVVTRDCIKTSGTTGIYGYHSGSHAPETDRMVFDNFCLVGSTEEFAVTENVEGLEASVAKAQSGATVTVTTAKTLNPATLKVTGENTSFTVGSGITGADGTYTFTMPAEDVKITCDSYVWNFNDGTATGFDLGNGFSAEDSGLVWICDPNSHTNGTAAKVNVANSATWTDYYVSTDVTVYKNTAANGYPMAALLVYGGITVRVRPDPVVNQYDISIAGDTAGDKTANITMNNTVVDGNVTDVSTSVSFNLAVKVGQGKLTIYIDGKEVVTRDCIKTSGTTGVYGYHSGSHAGETDKIVFDNFRVGPVAQYTVTENVDGLETDVATALPGAPVIITVTDPTLNLTALTVTGETTNFTVGNGITGGDGKYIFAMPAENVEITCDAPAAYTVTESVNGLEVDVPEALAGATVTITLDKMLDPATLAVTGENTSFTVGSGITGADGTYTFTMPAENVEITCDSYVWNFNDGTATGFDLGNGFSAEDSGLVWICDPNSHTNGTAAKVDVANSATWTDYYVSTDVTVYKNTVANGYPMAALLVYGGITVRVRPDPVANQYDISVAGDTAGDKTANITMNNTVVDGNVTDVSTSVSFNLAVKVGQGKLTVYIDGKEVVTRDCIKTSGTTGVYGYHSGSHAPETDKIVFDNFRVGPAVTVYTVTENVDGLETDVVSAQPGATVTITITDANLNTTNLKVTGENTNFTVGNGITGAEGTYTFIMPAENVEITCDAPATYTVTESVDGLEVDVSEAAEGATVTITLAETLDPATLTVTGENTSFTVGSGITGADGTYTFTMPAENVIVTANKLDVGLPEGGVVYDFTDETQKADWSLTGAYTWADGKLTWTNSGDTLGDHSYNGMQAKLNLTGSATWADYQVIANVTASKIDATGVTGNVYSNVGLVLYGDHTVRVRPTATANKYEVEIYKGSTKLYGNYNVVAENVATTENGKITFTIAAQILQGKVTVFLGEGAAKTIVATAETTATGGTAGVAGYHTSNGNCTKGNESIDFNSFSVKSVFAVNEEVDGLTVDAQWAAKGDTITITLAKSLDPATLTVTGENTNFTVGSGITGADGTYTFTMPGENVTVTASKVESIFPEDGYNYDFSDDTQKADWSLTNAYTWADGKLTWTNSGNTLGDHSYNGMQAKLNLEKSAAWSDYRVSANVTVSKIDATGATGNMYSNVGLVLYGDHTVRVRPTTTANKYEVEIYKGSTKLHGNYNVVVNNVSTTENGKITFTVSAQVVDGKLTVFLGEGAAKTVIATAETTATGGTAGVAGYHTSNGNCTKGNETITFNSFSVKPVFAVNEEVDGLTVDAQWAAKGDTVTITLDQSMDPATLKVTYSDTTLKVGEGITGSNNTYTFTMPAEEVTVVYEGTYNPIVPPTTDELENESFDIYADGTTASAIFPDWSVTAGGNEAKVQKGELVLSQAYNAVINKKYRDGYIEADFRFVEPQEPLQNTKDKEYYGAGLHVRKTSAAGAAQDLRTRFFVKQLSDGTYTANLQFVIYSYNDYGTSPKIYNYTLQDFQWGNSYHVKLSCIGNYVQVELDGVAIMQYGVDGELANFSGYFCVDHFANTFVVALDNLVVDKYDSYDISYSSNMDGVLKTTHYPSLKTGKAVNRNAFLKDEFVKLYVSAPTGYAVDGETLKYTGTVSGDVAITAKESDTLYGFKMPAENITVSAALKEAETVTVPVNDTFDTESLMIDRNWGSEMGILMGSARAFGSYSTFLSNAPGCENWLSYTAQATINVTASTGGMGAAALVVKGTDVNHGYEFGIEAAEGASKGRVRLYDRNNGKMLYYDAEETVELGKDVALKIVVTGTKLTGYANGVLKFSIDVEECTGGIGLKATKVNASFDNIIVTDIVAK